MTVRLTTCLGLLCVLEACSFFGKAMPMHPRFFDPEGELPSRTRALQHLGGPALRLGHVVGSTFLRERIAYHVSAHELGVYDERRWTERPEDYFRRALARSLFEERGLTNVVAGVAPVLDVELTDFAELLGPTHAVRVRAQVRLVDQRSVRLERSFSVEQAVAKGDDFALVAAAMSLALERAVTQIADDVERELSANPAVSAPHP